MPGLAIKDFQTIPPAPTPNELSFDLLAAFESGKSKAVPILTLLLPDQLFEAELGPIATVDLGDGVPSLFGAATFHEAVDDPLGSPDEDTTYGFNSGLTPELFGVSFGAMPTNPTRIDKVTLFTRGRLTTTNASGWRAFLRVGGTNYSGDLHDGTEHWRDLIFRTVAQEFALDPDTGLPWTEAGVNALVAAWSYLGDGGLGVSPTGGQRITQIAILVDYATTLEGRWSSGAVNSASLGLFQGRVTSWGIINRSAAGRSNALEASGSKVVIEDEDFTFSTLLAENNLNDVRKVSAVTQLAHPDVAVADWYTASTAILQGWKETRPNRWELDLRPNDEPINGKVPKGKVNEFDFPNADAKSYDLFVPAVYGRHNAPDITDEGMIELIPIDSVLFRYLVTVGIAKEVTNVFTKDGDADAVLKTLTTDYIVLLPEDSIINGRQYTIVEFVSDPGEGLVIRADVDGIEAIGDGTGTLLQNPATILTHFLVNFGFNDYQGGLWFADSTANVDVAKFNTTRDFFDTLGVGASRYIGGVSNAIGAKDEVNRFTRQFEVKVFWTGEGNLALLPNDHRTTEIYQDNNWLREGFHDVSEASLEFNTAGLIDRMLISYQHSQADNAFLANIEIRDFTVDEQRQESLQAFWYRSAKPEASP